MKIAIHKWNGTCGVCGGPTSGKRSKRCSSCYAKSRVGSTGWKPTDSQRKQISIRKTGSKASEETKEKMRTSRIVWASKPENKKKISEAANRSYQNGRRVGTNRSIMTKYNGINFRSRLEASFAEWLDCNGIKWIYEPKRFQLKNTTYLPDFYLPDRNEYIETKGYIRPGSLDKPDEFRKTYKVKITVIDSDTFKRLKTSALDL